MARYGGPVSQSAGATSGPLTGAQREGTTMQTDRTVTAAESSIISRATKLRRKLYALQAPAIADRFSRELADSWREADVAGVQAACRDLALDLADVPGSYDYFAEARSIAALSSNM